MLQIFFIFWGLPPLANGGRYTTGLAVARPCAAIRRLGLALSGHPSVSLGRIFEQSRLRLGIYSVHRAK
jgi:hypothetical protein